MKRWYKCQRLLKKRMTHLVTWTYVHTYNRHAAVTRAHTLFIHQQAFNPQFTAAGTLCSCDQLVVTKQQAKYFRNLIFSIPDEVVLKIITCSSCGQVTTVSLHMWMRPWDLHGHKIYSRFKRSCTWFGLFGCVSNLQPSPAGLYVDKRCFTCPWGVQRCCYNKVCNAFTKILGNLWTSTETLGREKTYWGYRPKTRPELKDAEVGIAHLWMILCGFVCTKPNLTWM